MRRYIVRSGRSYYGFNRRDYLIYKIFTSVCWLFLLAFGAASIVVKTDRIGSLDVPHQLWFVLALCSAILGYIGTRTLLSRGVVQDIDKSGINVAADERKDLAVQNTGNLSMIISSLLLVILLSLAIVSNLSLNKPTSPGVVWLFLLAVAGFGYALVRRRKIRAALVADRQPRVAISWPHMVPLMVIAFLLVSALYNLWNAAAQHPASTRQHCSPGDATTWAVCADFR
jgi:hypothetical protein